MFPFKAGVVWQWRLLAHRPTFLLPAVLQPAVKLTNAQYLASLRSFGGNCSWVTLRRCKGRAMLEECGSNSVLQQVLIDHITTKREAGTQCLQRPSPAAVQSAAWQTQRGFRGPAYFWDKELPFCFSKGQ